MHIILTPGFSENSIHPLESLLQCNNFLKYSVKSFKTAILSYKNKEIIDELLKIVLSC